MKKIITLFTIVITFSCFSQVVKIVDADAIGPLTEFKNKQFLIQFGAYPGLKSTNGISPNLVTEYTGANGAAYSFTAKNANYLYVMEISSNANLLVTTGTGSFTNIKSFNTSSSGSLPKMRLAPTLQILGTEEVKRAPNNFIGNKLIFLGIDPTAQIMRLWKSEGTTVSTVEILSSTGSSIDVLDDSFGENISGLIYFNGRTNTTDKYHLWRTDGTLEGTFPVLTTLGEKLYTPTKSTIENLNGELLFVATTNVSNATTSGDLWKTNGTSNGTVKLFSIPYHGQYINNNTPAKFFGKVFQNKFYFYGNDGTIGGYVLYVTDGTISGTVLLKNSSNQNIKAPGVQIVFYNDENYIYFPGKGRKELAPGFFIDWDYYYASQGTNLTTKAINEIGNIPAISYVYKTTDGLIVNTGNNSFRFNGYESPTATSFTSSQLNLLSGGFSHKSKVWFAAAEGTVNEELWCSDATQNGTKRFADIVSGSGSSGPKGFFSINDDLFVFAKFGSQTGGFVIYKIGEDYTFNGLVSNNWNVGSNWNAGSTPTTVDNATIPSGFNVNVSSNAYAKNAMINGNVNLVTGNLDLYGYALMNNNAKITLNTNNLNLKGANSSLVGSSTSHVVTNGTGKVTIEKMNASRGTVLLPIGTGTSFHETGILNNGTSDTFSVRVENGVTSNYVGETQGTAISEKAVNTTWHIGETTPGGSDVALTFRWNASQELANFNRNTAKIGHYNGSGWDMLTSALSGSGPYTLQTNNVSSFSPFIVVNEELLSSNQFENANDFMVYPNPSNGNFTIQVPDSFIGSRAVIYNLLGQSIKEFSINEVNQNTNLEKGVYLLQIQKGNQVSTQKIIIQ